GDTTPALQTAGSLGLRSYLGSGYTGILPVSSYWDDLSAIALVPMAPTSLSATAMSSSQINLSWTNNATNADSYTVERSPDGSSWAVVTSSLPGTATSYGNTGLSPSTTYYYRVKATNAAGSSGYSNTASATTLASGAPPPPTGLTAVPATGKGVQLSWS